MTIEEVLALNEKQDFDRKSIKIDSRSLAQTVVAFANADGGTIAIGITDKTKTIEGIDDYNSKLNELLKVPFDFCNPTVQARIEKVPCIDCHSKENHIVLMHIEASAQVHATQADEVYYRVGDSSKLLSFEERLQLTYDKGERYFEDKIVAESSLDDIDLNLVTDYAQIIGYTKTPLEYLKQNKSFAKEINGQLQFSTAAILLFGKKPQDFFPRARVRFIRYQGIEEKVGTEMNVIKDVIFTGTILQMIQKSIEYLTTQIKEHTYLGKNGLFVTEQEYPEFVRQELIVNAVTHRAYNIMGTDIQIKMFDNRIVVESPGKLPGMVRTDNIRYTHFSRNPKIAEFLKAYHFVKEYGEGVDRMCREQEQNGSQNIEYKENAFMLQSIAYSANFDEEIQAENAQKTNKNCPENAQKTAQKQKAIIEYLKNNPLASRNKIALALGFSEDVVKHNLKTLQDKNILCRKGPDKGGHWEIIENNEKE